MNKAVFLDRDGTLIEYVPELTRPEQLKILPGAVESARILHKAGFVCLILTNQPIVEKGIISREHADEINRVLVKKFADEGARIDDVFMCPHKFNESKPCACRKPGQALILEAKEKFDLDLARSFIVGDSLRDVETGKRGGMKTILIKTENENSKEDAKYFHGTPDNVVSDVKAAAEYIIALR